MKDAGGDGGEEERAGEVWGERAPLLVMDDVLRDGGRAPSRAAGQRRAGQEDAGTRDRQTDD